MLGQFILKAIAFLSIACVAHASVAGDGGPPQFHAPWRAYDVGNDVKPQTVEFGDIDGDGDRDAVVAHDHFSDPGISILRSNGDGTFAPEERYDVLWEVGDAVFADFEGDGDLDVFATTPGNAGTGYRIALFKNDGAGNFSAPQYFTTGNGPVGMVAADFTGDGWVDVVTADNGYVAGDNNTISILKHNGQAGAAAGFLPAVQFISGDDSTRVDAADIDGDGDLDLAVGRGDFAHSGDHGVSILFNDGSGGFAGLTQYGELTGAYRTSPAVHFADVDNDGDPDLIYGGASNSGFDPNTLIGICLNDGAGVFGPAEVLMGPNGTYTPYYITTSDLDGDGRLDILATIGSGRQFDGFVLFRSLAKGGYFGGVFHRAAKWTKDIEAEDVDGDGDDDVVTVASFSAVITVHENPGAGDFLRPDVFPVTDIIRDMKAGDLDIDGDIDLLVAGFTIYGGAVVAVLWNDGKGFFEPELLSDQINAGYVELVDLNGDNCLDILLSPYLNGGFGFWIALNTCEDGFEPFTAYSGGGGAAAGIGAFDIDDDGDLDIVLPDRGSQNDTHLFRNSGDGVNFTFMGAIPDSVSGEGVAGADVNHDGNIDLITRFYTGVTLFPGNGDFSFGAPWPTGDYVTPIVLADVGGDGEYDLSGAMPSSFSFTGVIGVMRGFGDGGFAFPVTYPAATDFEFYIDEVMAHDMNGDGIDDLVVSNGPSSDVSIFLSNGDGTLQPHDGRRFGVGYNASNAVVADFNDDQILDIATTVDYGSVSVILGRHTGGGGGGEAAVLTDVDLAFGTHFSGGVPELEESDNQYLHARSQFGFSAAEPNIVDLVTGFESPFATASAIDFAIEARINNPGGAGKVRIWNFSRGAYEEVGTFSTLQQDKVTAMAGIDPAMRIDPGDRRIEFSTRISVIATFSADGFDAWFDDVQVIVHPDGSK